MTDAKVMDKLNSLFKEEQWGRIEPKDIGTSKFKILDDLFNSIVSEDLISETYDICKKHIEENRDSITAMYLMGLIGYHRDNIEDSIMLRKLIDIFIDNHKWAVVEIISEKILEYGESSIALRALAMSLERLGRSKDAIPVLENLLKIDRFDAEVSKKLSLAIIDENPEKSIQYMKLSIEGFIKNNEFDEVINLWNKLVSVSWEDTSFFDRVERMLVDARHTELVSTLLKTLLNKYKEEENVDYSIELLKKILTYRPADSHARRELIKLYTIKYGSHSQFKQFLKLSKLEDFRSHVKYAIMDFEKNIVFDKGNYVFHKSWKLGKIVDIESEFLTIDFIDKTGHKMSIGMALQSLTPINKEHLYVIEFEDTEMIKTLFEDDFMQFFQILVKSYGGQITLSDIKHELIPKFVKEKDWAKWWSKARTKIKKDPLFGVSDKRKDLIYMRDKPLTFADELLGNFIKTESFSEKLDIAIEFINNITKSEGAKVVQYFIDYFLDEVKGKSETRQVLSYFILKDLAEFTDTSKLNLDSIRSKVLHFIKGSNELNLISIKISSYDYKKQFVNLIMESRDDWTEVVSQILFEIPVRIHKFIINVLIRAHAYGIINRFIDNVTTGSRQYPEVFIWAAKNILNKTWDYDWLDYSKSALIIAYFRLMNELKKIETDSNRLKNMTIDILFSNDEFALREIVREFDSNFLSKIYDLVSNVSYIEEGQVDKVLEIIKEKYPGFKVGQTGSSEEAESDFEKLIVTQKGYDRKKAELERLVNVEMIDLSKELAKVSEVSGDLRENVEYTALMEKQAILKMAISRLDNDIKKADILNVEKISTECVNIGTKVKFKDLKTGEVNSYSILGPWDADFELKILSYRSPIAKALLGSKVNDEVEIRINDENKRYKIISIEKCSL